jgi:hypothetical protein
VDQHVTEPLEGTEAEIGLRAETEVRKHTGGKGAVKFGNRYDCMEWAGAFGDIGTLIPFVVAYITIVHVDIVHVDPLGLLFMFGVCKVAAGLYYKMRMPIQPMKAIGAAAISRGISPAVLFGSGLTTGLFWSIAGATGSIMQSVFSVAARRRDASGTSRC